MLCQHGQQWEVRAADALTIIPAPNTLLQRLAVQAQKFDVGSAAWWPPSSGSSRSSSPLLVSAESSAAPSSIPATPSRTLQVMGMGEGSMLGTPATSRVDKGSML